MELGLNGNLSEYLIDSSNKENGKEKKKNSTKNSLLTCL
jgi:hypothetical protein